jgi:hypothetical protein
MKVWVTREPVSGNFKLRLRLLPAPGEDVSLYFLQELLVLFRGLSRRGPRAQQRYQNNAEH